MTALCVMLSLAAPVEVVVLPFKVPDEIHDGIKNEMKLWPKKMAEAFKKGDPVKFVEWKEAGYTVMGGAAVVDGGKKLVIDVRLNDNRRILWSEKYELTDIAKKVEFLDETRKKIVAGVKKTLGPKPK